MTTTPEATGPDPVSVPQALADVLKLWHDHKLPDPTSMDADQVGDGDTRVDLGFATRSALDAWNAVLGGNEPRTQPYKDGTLHNGYVFAQPGRNYRVAMSAHTPADAHTELPAETLTALDHIAGGAA